MCQWLVWFLSLLLGKCALASEWQHWRMVYADTGVYFISYLHTENIWPRKQNLCKRVAVWHFCLRFSITSWTWLLFLPSYRSPTWCFREILFLIGFVLRAISQRSEKPWTCSKKKLPLISYKIMVYNSWSLNKSCIVPKSRTCFFLTS